MSDQSMNPKKYIVVWLWLFILTAIEVGIAMTDITRGILVLSLLVLAAAKAALVGLFFMHLRFEKPLLGIAITSTLVLAFIYVAASHMDDPTAASGWDRPAVATQVEGHGE